VPVHFAISVNDFNSHWQNVKILEHLFANCIRFFGVSSGVVEALRHKPEGCGFDAWWGHWDFILNLSFWQ